MRIALIVISLAAAAFLAVQEPASRAAAHLQKVALSAKGNPTPDQLRAAKRQVTTATRWNPDTEPELNLGIIQARAGDFPAGGATVAQVTRQEPENGQAWSLLVTFAGRYDSDLAATARERVRVLMPPVPRAR